MTGGRFHLLMLFLNFNNFLFLSFSGMPLLTNKPYREAFSTLSPLMTVFLYFPFGRVVQKKHTTDFESNALSLFRSVQFDTVKLWLAALRYLVIMAFFDVVSPIAVLSFPLSLNTYYTLWYTSTQLFALSCAAPNLWLPGSDNHYGYAMCSWFSYRLLLFLCFLVLRSYDAVS